MRYTTPELRALGTFARLTKGVGGSCPDGGGRNSTQLGGGADFGGVVECGPGTGRR
jgi:hypothetical protein